MTIHNGPERRQRLCSVCRTDITEPTRYQRKGKWRQCSPCYWRVCGDRPPAVEALLARRRGIDQQVAALSKALEGEKAHRQRLDALEKMPRTWSQTLKELALGREADQFVLSSATRHSNLVRQLEELQRQAGDAERRLDKERRLREAAEAEARRTARRRAQQQKREEATKAFAERSRSAALDSYARELFVIRKKDYKRGNPLNNHFGKRFLQQVLAAFQGRCLVCRGTHDLTLDHFAIPVNEGGTFVLLLADRSGIRMNLVVLCRSCNSAKGESSYRAFFSPSHLKDADTYQKRLLDEVLGDELTMEIIRSWYSVATG